MAKAPRMKAPPSSMAYTSIDRYGDVRHTFDARARPPASIFPDGCGTWWPDYGPNTGDFGYMFHAHPTETLFDHDVEPFIKNQVRLRQPVQSSSASEGSACRVQPQQFRHPAPQTEALYSSTIILPYKKGGRRKCSDDNHWKAVMGGSKRYPIQSNGPLVGETAHLLAHPLQIGGDQTMARSCSSANLAAGGATGTNPCESMQRTVSCTALAAGSSTFLSPVSGRSIKALPGITGGQTLQDSLRLPARLRLAVPGGGSKMPSWVATRTVATRDPDAAGHGSCLLRKLPIEMQGF